MKTTKKFHEYLNDINNVSKKSALIIGVFTLSILNLNAINKKTVSKAPVETIEINRNHIAQVFDWEVKTDKGIYSGTALSLKAAKQMISLSTNGDIVKAKKITSYFVLKSEANTHLNRNYFWEVETPTGFAKGYASSEAYAHKIMQLVASGDAIVSKKIISQPQQ